MKDLFNMDGGLMSFLFRMTDLLVLNIVFIITCIPIVTIGPALTALYSITLKMAKGEEAYVFTGYLKAFKDNFKISFMAWLILLAAFTLSYADYRISESITGTLGTVLVVCFLAMFFILSFITLYLFPYIARFKNTLKASFKNAVLIAIASLPYTILLIVITGAVIGVSAMVIPLQYTFLIWLLFGFSALAFGQSFIFRRVFAKYELPVDEATEKSSSPKD